MKTDAFMMRIIIQEVLWNPYIIQTRWGETQAFNMENF